MASLFNPFDRLHRHERVFAPERDDPIDVAGPGDVSANETVAKATQLVPIQVGDEVVNQLGRRGWFRLDPVHLELRENRGSISVRHQGRDEGVARTGQDSARYARASEIS